jgi:Transglycosylase SLT domain/LysM domain
VPPPGIRREAGVGPLTDSGHACYKRFKSSYMPIRASFRLLLASLVGILTPIAISPACAESQSSTPDFFEVSVPVSVPSTSTNELIRPIPAPDTKTGEPSLQDDSSVWVPEDFDPWAYAFAESSRLQARSVRFAKVPTYSVAMNSQVRYFVDRFTTSRRDVVGLWVRRSGQYLGMIFHVFRAKGLPEDLAFTAMIESGFNPVAVSRVGAKGLWQFMAPTARLYGLRVDRWVDERLDPEKSTVAAAGYLNDLYVRYGSWELAQAAYNAGEVKVDRAIRGTGSTDFWDLSRSKYLRRETKDFVPAIQAAMVIGRDPSQYGFDPSPMSPPDVERVTVPASTDLRKLAASSGVPLQTLRSLNPVLIRGISPPGRTWEIRVPGGTREAVAVALTPAPRAKVVVASAPGHRAPTVGVHVVRVRDTVSSIAKLYGVSTSDVVRWNNLENGDAIRPGDRLRVTSLRPTAELDGQGGFR